MLDFLQLLLHLMCRMQGARMFFCTPVEFC
jgi:hypothetical protein